ncbi:MAG: hypothetical protein K9N51_02525 [Candidatus Pacebacteria bacterium]|nr:hypothetical protein [Candidatus Paceibacterota bacterium]
MRIANPITFFIPVPRLTMLVAATVLLATGCGDTDEPEYNHVRTQIVSDAFEAFDKDDPQAAVTALNRLAGISEEDFFIHRALRRAYTRDVVKTTNARLAAGDVTAAEKLISQAINTHSASPALIEASKTVTALAALDHYLESRPYENVAAAKASLAEVERYRNILHRADSYVAWLDREEARLAKARKKEIQAAVATLIEQCDQLIVAGHAGAELHFRDIASLDPDHPLPRLRRDFLTNSEALAEPLDTETTLSRPIQQAVEMIACKYWNQLPNSVIKKLYKNVYPAPSASMSGSKLKARLAAAAGKPAEALEYARQTLRHSSEIDDSFVAEIMTSAVLDKKQFTARPWRVPFPTVGDLLNQLIQIRQQNP